ncbi:bifunctional lysylphosphatidylglycerol flippase/synthetase MprF [Streptomyces sp. NPDC101393]|uniref:bifunctional lysylphosphatidylglycerol flippase/synthetase MprF n=1 Tax=Streptomyces sp. NPDC101393 TaxID=3366141 RepID=UPI00381558BF
MTASAPAPAPEPDEEAGAPHFLSPERGLGRLLHAVGPVLAPARRAWLTLTLLVALWVVGAATGSLTGGPSDALLRRIGVGVPALSDGHWWSPLSSLGWASGLGGYLGTTLVLLLLLAPAEQRMGAARSAAVLVGGQILGTLLGTGLIALGSEARETWLHNLSDLDTTAPSTGILAVAAVLSYELTALWRRRVRLLITVVPLVLALYVGHAQQVMHVGGVLVGFALGAVLHRGTRHLRARRSSNTEGRVLVALAVAAFAIGPALAALYKDALGPFALISNLIFSSGPDKETIDLYCASSAQECHLVHAMRDFYHSPALLMGAMVSALLLVLAEGLRRGLRAAWRITIVVLAVWLALMAFLAVDVSTDPDQYSVQPSDVTPTIQALVEQMALVVLVLLLMVLTRVLFALRLPGRAVRSLAAVVLGTLLLACAAYLGIGMAVRDQYEPTVTFPDLLANLPAAFLPPDYDGLFWNTPVPVGGTALALYEYVGLCFWVITLVALFLTFRRPRVRQEDRAAHRARQLLTAHGGSTLSYLTTWPGNHYWFDDTGSAAVAYRVHSTVALTTGDPFGDPAARGDAVDGFARYCDLHGWTPAFYSVTAAVKSRADALGWKAVQVAEDTVVPLAGLAFTGKKWQDVRTALNKAKKQGITAEWCTFPDAPLALRDQIRSISEEWVSDKGLPEMGFTLGGLDELDDPHVRCLLAVDKDRTVHGITSWMPTYLNGEPVGWTLDFMRRRADGFRGSMEFLIASAALGFQEEGAAFLSLSGAPLARKDTADPPIPLQRLLDYAGKALEPVYGFRSLLNFKAKFQPEYHPMYLVYPDSAALPNITRAIGKAYLPHMSPAQGLRLARRLSS